MAQPSRPTRAAPDVKNSLSFARATLSLQWLYFLPYNATKLSLISLLNALRIFFKQGSALRNFSGFPFGASAAVLSTKANGGLTSNETFFFPFVFGSSTTSASVFGELCYVAWWHVDFVWSNESTDWDCSFEEGLPRGSLHSNVCLLLTPICANCYSCCSELAMSWTFCASKYGRGSKQKSMKGSWLYAWHWLNGANGATWVLWPIAYWAKALCNSAKSWRRSTKP